MQASEPRGIAMSEFAEWKALYSVGFFSSPAERRELRSRISSELSLNHLERASLALVDFPTVNHVCRLFEGLPVGDPFVGISDLATLISAMVLYDRVLVLPVNPVADRADSVLHHEGVIRTVHLDTPAEETPPPADFPSDPEFFEDSPYGNHYRYMDYGSDYLQSFDNTYYRRLNAHWEAANEDIKHSLYSFNTADGVLSIQPDGIRFRNGGFLSRTNPNGWPEKQRKDYRWLERLLKKWQRLLPGAVSDLGQYRAGLGQSYASGYGQSGASVRLFELSTTDLPSLYSGKGVRSWDYLQKRSRPSLAADNDLRALYYLRVAADLQQILASDEAGTDITVRYLGGLLRTPMIATASEEVAYSLGSSSSAVNLEDQLSDWWATTNLPIANTITLPFWLSAVMARADKKEDIPEVILHYRQRASRLRKRRWELEVAIGAGDKSVITKLHAAMASDADALTKDLSAGVKTTLDVADAGIRAVAPLPFGPSRFMYNVAEIPIQRALMRIFRPYLAVVYDLGKNASRLSNSLPKAWKIFDLPPGVAEYPTKFFQELGHVDEYG
jgi:hypothetical protein